MSQEHNSGASAPTMNTIELVKAAQTESRAKVNGLKVNTLRAAMELESIGGKDHTDESVLAVVREFPQGIPYPFLQMVFPDAALVAAREALKKAGKIQQVGKKGNIIIKPVVEA